MSIYPFWWPINKVSICKLSYEEDRLIDLHLDKITWLDNLEMFSKLEAIFPETYEKIISDSSFMDKVLEIVATEMSSVDNSDWNSLKGQLEGLETLYNISLAEELEDLEKREKEYSAYLDSEAESFGMGIFRLCGGLLYSSAIFKNNR